MKIRNIFSILALASSLVFAGCEKEEERVGSFDNIKLDKTFISFPADGGSVDLKVTATEDWKFVVDENWPKIITFNSGKKATHDVWGNLTNDAADIKSSKDSWVLADVTEGNAGEVTVKFTAEAFKGGREQAVAIVCGGSKQHLILRQGDLDPVQLTCKEIKETAAVGASYSTRGVVTKLGNYASYGAFYINDGTYDEDVQVYGSTKDSMKDYPNVEVGDSVYFSGTWSSYKNFENVTITKLKKSLAKVMNSSRDDVSMEGETLEVVVAFKGKGVNPVVPEDYQSWISVLGITSKNGIPTKLETNPADTAYVTVRVEANNGGDRTGVINFTSSTSEASSEVSYSFTQKGAILQVTVGEFLKAAVSPAQYRLTGTVKKISVSEQYNNADITVADALGNSVLVRRMKPASGKITDLTIAVGDKLTVVGQRGESNGTAQMVNGVYESHVHYIPATIKEFLAKEVSDVEYIVTGKIVNIKEISASFKNATLTIADDEGTTLYVFRMKAAEGGPAIENIGLKVGDVLTVIGKRGEFNGSAQMVNGYYVSHEAGSVDPEPEPGDNSYSIDLSYKLGANAYDDNVATINGKENVKVLKFGASKGKTGDLTITVPAGSKRVSFYALAWKGAATTLEFSGLGMTFGTQGIRANDGVAGQSPYKITVTDDDYYTFTVPTALTEDLDIKITTAASAGNNTRAILFGIKAFKE